MIIASIFVCIFYAYLLAGLFFGVWFVFRGVQKIDGGMEGGSWKLRLLLLPGSMALWPLLLKKYLQKNQEI